MMRPESIPAPGLVRFAIVPPDTAPLSVTVTNVRDIAISPDGTQVVYMGIDSEAGVQHWARLGAAEGLEVIAGQFWQGSIVKGGPKLDHGGGGKLDHPVAGWRVCMWLRGWAGAESGSALWAQTEWKPGWAARRRCRGRGQDAGAVAS